MLYESAYFSLIVQFIIGLINIYGLNIDVPNDKKIFKALSDIGFEEINQDIRKYFDYPSYSPIYIASFEIIALFITPKLDDILSEKLFYYAKR